MNIKKTVTAAAVCAALALTATGLSACGENTEMQINLLHLEVPTNVAVVDGGDDTTNDDDYVTFTGVENAVSYQLFVYQDGDERAKVVSGETSPLYMPSDLTAGTYIVQVRAVGDLVTYDGSNGSEAITYNCKTVVPVAEKLASVTNVTMDFTKVDKTSATFPTISFTGVDNALRYSAYMYDATYDSATEAYTKTGTDSVTNFNIPASSSTDGTVSYMIDQTNFSDLKPGYYAIEVYARGDDENYLDSDAATGYAAWTGYQLAVPTPVVSNSTVTIQNVTDNYFVGTEFTVEVYSDEDCTTNVATLNMTYTGSSTSFGQTSYNYSGNTLTVGEGGLTAGETYYFKAMAKGDDTLTISSDYSDVVAAQVNEQQSSGGGDMGGGDMGGGGSADASWDFSLIGSTYEISATESTSDFMINDSQTIYSTFYAILDATPATGCSYSYTFSHNDTDAPFVIDAYLYLYTDNTATFHLSAAGPINEQTFTGTWSIDGDTITVVFTA